MPGSSSSWLTEKRGGTLAVLFALATRISHYIGYLVGQRTELYYWPVLACRKFESAAMELLHGGPAGGPFTYASPLYRYFLLPFYAAGTGRTGLFVFQSLLGVLTAWMIFRLALRAGAGTRPALAGAAVWSLYAPAVFFELTVLPVALLTVLISFFTLIGTSGMGGKAAASSGLAAGLISGLRPPFILLLGVPVWKWLRKREWRMLLISFAALLLPLLFLSYQHDRAGGGFYPFPRTAGTNLVLGHSSESSGYGPPIPSLGLVETGRGDIHDVAAQVAADLGYSTPKEADAYWMRTALSWMAENPLEELRLMAVKVGGFFGAGAFDTYYEMGRIRRFNPVFRWFFFVPRLLPVIIFLTGLVSFCVGGKNRAVILAPVAVALLSSVVFVHSERYFLPALPLMVAAGVSGLTVLFRRAGTAPLRWAGAGTLGLLLLLPSLIHPVPAVPEELFISSLAVRAYHMEDYNKALELFERAALLARRGSVVWVQGHSEAAGIARALGYTERAEQHEDILQEAGFLPN